MAGFFLLYEIHSSFFFVRLLVECLLFLDEYLK